MPGHNFSFSTGHCRTFIRRRKRKLKTNGTEKPTRRRRRRRKRNCSARPTGSSCRLRLKLELSYSTVPTRVSLSLSPSLLLSFPLCSPLYVRERRRAISFLPSSCLPFLSLLACCCPTADILSASLLPACFAVQLSPRLASPQLDSIRLKGHTRRQTERVRSSFFLSLV